MTICVCIPIWFGNIIENEISDLPFNVTWLVSYWDLKTCQIQKLESIKHMQLTLVSPGRSTRVRSKTSGEYIRRDIGNLLTPLFCPATLKVSCSISFLISLKSVNFLSMCRN